VVADSAAHEVTALVQHLIGNSEPAAAHMKAVLRSLAPLLAEFRERTSR
jgi:hypothetical protein